MTHSLSLIGYGEAGRTFARAAGWEMQARVFDVKSDAPQTRAALLGLYSDDNVVGCDDLAETLLGSPVILSLVTADQALAVASDAAQHVAPGALYFDMNSVAPDTKREAAVLIEEAGGRYVDVAIIAPVDPARLAVPLLVSGPHSAAAVAILSELGFTNVRLIAGEVGRASSIKMIRSIMVKGQEALTAEMMLAAEQAGVADDVLQSLGDGWASKAEYNLERMRTHGMRRAAEMEEVAKTLGALGVEPLMTRGTITRQRQMAQSEQLT